MGLLKRHIALALATVAGAALSGHTPAAAQPEETTVLPDIHVTQTRLSGTNRGRRGTGAGTTTIQEDAPAGDGGADAAASAIVAGNIATGSSTSVITSRDIERSPAQTLPEVLAQQAGIQLQRLFGSREAVDLRGFGAFSHSNVLILVNGRRYQDFDLQGFDFASIPLNGIERIEITRGNSGTVLYGDGAIGGVINIVTKRGASVPTSARVEGAFGSFNHREGRISANGSWGPWATSIFSNVIDATGYRRNSDWHQRNVVGELNYTGAGWSAFLNIAADSQRQGLPGGLPNRQPGNGPHLLSQPRESNTPLDRGDKQGVNVTAGFVYTLAQGVDLIVDGGVRRKFQQATYFSYFNPPDFLWDPTTAVPANYVDTVMTTSSFTPRLDATHWLLGVQSRLLTGFDFYHTQYNSDRSQSSGSPVIHHYDIRQTTAAWYAMNKAAVTPDLDVSAGGRLQRNMIRALDVYNAAVDPNACCYGVNPQAPPLDRGEWQYAAHVGAEYRMYPALTLFGRAARAFRLGNADERVGGGNPFGLTAPANFDLKTQTSYDFEGGFRVARGRFFLQSSVYDMYLTNEIHFIPALQYNTNLDPTRRTGWETSTVYILTDDVRLRGALAYVRAVFREGPFAGNQIPLVSPWTGSAGVTWDIVKRLLVLDVNARFWSERRMDNDQINRQPLIPANATVDVKLSGAYDRFYWSLAVLNIFDVKYYDYAIASGGFPAGPFGPATPPTIGRFDGYPQPGRNYMVRAGGTF